MCPPAKCLADILASIEEHEASPVTRYQLVLHAVCRAIDDGLEAGFRSASGDPDQLAAFIELPTGQVSWPIPQHVHEFDGHAVRHHDRIHAFQRQVVGDEPSS